jgi:hypothetical protein
MSGLLEVRDELENRAHLAEIQLENFYRFLDSAYKDAEGLESAPSQEEVSNELREGIEYGWLVLDHLQEVRQDEEDRLDDAIERYREMDQWLDTGFFEMSDILSIAEDELPDEYREHISEAERALRNAEGTYTEIMNEIGIYLQNELDKAGYETELDPDFPEA